MLGLIVFLCIICPWIIPCVLCIWILDKLCWKFIDWSIKFSQLSFKARYFWSWAIVSIIMLSWATFLSLISGTTMGVVLVIAIFIFILFLIFSIITSIILSIRKLFRKKGESE